MGALPTARRRHGGVDGRGEKSTAGSDDPSGRPRPLGHLQRAAPRRRTTIYLLILAALAVPAGSAVAITRLQQSAATRGELRVLLAEVEKAAWQQNALRSRALLAKSLPATLAQTRDQIDRTVDTIGATFERRDPGDRYARAVQDAFLTYDAVVDREFDLLESGDLLTAERVDENQAVPTFIALRAALDDAARHYDRLARQSSGRARIGTVLILALAACGLAGLVSRAHRIRTRAFRRAVHQATHDALTGLPNRVRLHDEITATIATTDADATSGAALLLIDLDRFKEINDTLGHHYGDRLLILVARRMRDTVRGGETVARLGGDEFAVLLPGITGAQDAAAAATRLHEALQQPFDLGGISLAVGGSIGAALYPHHGTTADELLQHADIAMYTAKTRRTGFTVFEPGQGSTDPRKLSLAADLRHGMARDELTLHYQPKVDARTGDVLGAEALVRWQHPEHGMIPPSEFIPLAEHTGLITPLTRIVLDSALRQCRAWRDEGHQLSVAVNVSAHGLLDRDLATEVADRLRRWRVPAHLLTIEITETAIMTDPGRALQVVEQLHALGVRLSIDDFGTGYSSLAYLKNLPVHELKIDRSFVSCMTTSHRDAVIVRSTVELGRNLGLRVVAEGVEDDATWRALEAAGCDVVQGYLISRPVPPAEFSAWLHHRGSAAPVAVAN
ncbi:EAL domain-containing protein [Actinoplanes oblitus]|uniref:EAL domain-containing protein n=1 Tax=Actinoplanes oblitus TaxID=3040509 RepID=A0ABY8W5Q7_9ACTN|nr:EAL domain-containing protein [Actinoplanes oblitus]WIM93023.1 EAL domain-containing protein [Actinoplanes oblitus]